MRKVAPTLISLCPPPLAFGVPSQELEPSWSPSEADPRAAVVGGLECVGSLPFRTLRLGGCFPFFRQPFFAVHSNYKFFKLNGMLRILFLLL